jgi:Ca2+-binding EF-hand superfamily protein
MFDQRLRAMDKNGDGKVSKDEFTGPAGLFDRLDANSDGFVTPEEMRQFRPEPGKAKAKAKAKIQAKAKAARRPATNNP